MTTSPSAGTVIGTAENENEGWAFDGFRPTTGSEVEKFFRARADGRDRAPP